MKDKTAENLRKRIGLLKERVALIEIFAKYDLKQSDVAKIADCGTCRVSNYFAGREDSPEIEAAVKSLIRGKGVAV